MKSTLKKHEKGLLRRRLRIQAKPHGPTFAVSSPVERFSSLASQWAQVLMLGLVAFGYFYTVRPVHQHALLQEENAKLSQENDRIRGRVASATATLEEMQAEGRRLIAENQALVGKSTALELQKKSLEGQKEELEKDAELALASLRSLERSTAIQIEEAQRALIGSTFVLHFLDEIDLPSNPFSPHSSVDLGDWMVAPQMQPYEVVSAKIEDEIRNQTYFGLPEPHFVSQKLIGEMESTLVRSSELLHCPSLNRSLWVQAWVAAEETISETLDDCVKFRADQLLPGREGGENKVQPFITFSGEPTEDSVRVECGLLGQLHRESMFRDSLTDYDTACQARLLAAGAIALGETVEFEPFPSELPPTIDAEWFRTFW